ncbi:MAG: tetratricopeptide repeat protein [Armatimonadetes bacterium]|nr:tetratricopeptide repeat protein [Armatimonadota bacterium]
MDIDARNQKSYNRALVALEKHDFDRAAQLGHELIESNYSGGYEVRGRALYGLGECEEAIRTLEQGTKRFPQIPPLWSFLGEFYSNEGRYEDALAAFQQHKEAGGFAVATNYNLSIIYGRQGRFALALKALEDSFGGEMPDHLLLGTKASYLTQLGRFEEALEAAEQSLKLEETSHSMGEKAKALLSLGRKDEAKDATMAALRINSSEGNALEVLRRFNEFSTADSKGYRILASGTFPSGGPAPGGPKVDGFYATFWAVADSPEEALEFYAEIEPDARDLKVEKFSVESDDASGPKGVVMVDQSYHFFVTERNPLKRWLFRIRAKAHGKRLE